MIISGKHEYYRARDDYVTDMALQRVSVLRDSCYGRFGDLSYTERVALVRLVARVEEVAV